MCCFLDFQLKITYASFIVFPFVVRTKLIVITTECMMGAEDQVHRRSRSFFKVNYQLLYCKGRLSEGNPETLKNKDHVSVQVKP